MEIQRVPLPGVPAHPQEGPTSAPNRGPTAGVPGSPAEIEPNLPGQDAGGEVPFSMEPPAAGDEKSELLSPGEKQILGLLFDDEGGEGLTLYGTRPVKPVVMGNFLDVRG
ncbi:MAG: hypothetical protein V3U35_04830 [Candidatus Neomarinimicrobiota bacterium]